MRVIRKGYEYITGEQFLTVGDVVIDALYQGCTNKKEVFKILFDILDKNNVLTNEDLDTIFEYSRYNRVKIKGI